MGTLPLTSSAPVLLIAPEIRGGMGGIQTYGAALLEVLRERTQVECLIKNDTPENWEQNERVFTYGASIQCLRTFSFASGVLLQCIRTKPSLVIYLHSNASPLSLFHKLFPGTPSLLIAHGIEVWRGVSPLVRQAWRVTDQAVTVSGFTHAQMVQRGVLEKGTSVVRIPGPLLPVFTPGGGS